MASKYPIQKEDQDLVSTDKYLDASGHWSVPEGGSSTLADLTDVEIENPTDGQTLLYNSTTHKFENGDGGSANIPEYTYSYWLAHRAELEATGKPFIITNAPPSPDLVAENIGYGSSNVGTALDQIRNYSTSEKVVGTWVDGKPLYQMVISNESGVSITANVDYMVIDMSAYADKIISISGVITNSNHLNEYPLPYFGGNTQGYKRTDIIAQEKVVKIRSEDNWSSTILRIIIHYTKTTD